MDLNHRSLAYETSGDDRTPLLRDIIYALLVREEGLEPSILFIGAGF